MRGSKNFDSLTKCSPGLRREQCDDCRRLTKLSGWPADSGKYVRRRILIDGSVIPMSLDGCRMFEAKPQMETA